tara:strand:- start:1660 stop:2067 length:408 start_codon:yes stop_codon:yes gene_type:complete
LLRDVQILNLHHYSDERGSLVISENSIDIPFDIKRLYYLYGAPRDSVRGKHGHRDLQQVLIPINGSFEVKLDDGQFAKSYSLEDRTKGLYVPRMMWREIYNFSPDAVCLVLASELYDADDYFYPYSEFIKVTKGQ